MMPITNNEEYLNNFKDLLAECNSLFKLSYFEYLNEHLEDLDIIIKKIEKSENFDEKMLLIINYANKTINSSLNLFSENLLELERVIEKFETKFLCRRCRKGDKDVKRCFLCQ